MSPLIRRAWFTFAALLAWTGSAMAVQVQIDEAGLTAAEVQASRRLVEAAVSRLPPGFLAAAPPLSLRWRDDLPDEVHGRVRGGRIGLRRELLAAWMSRGGGSEPGAPLAALLHELGHVHDRSAQGGLSRDPRLLDLAGWPLRPLRPGLRASRNDFSDRSPDDYERRSPAEFVAVNLEYFLLDPEYACRRPALHRHFSAHFGWAPPAAACASPPPFVGAGDEGDVVRLYSLDPQRVQEVHYLFAEANARPMSRWGHSMLRLVVCAPGREPGEDCRYDLDHHLVLSFRAFVDDLQISSWRGLTGAYPSRLFVLPLQQVVDEYTKVELRGLQSVPLRLDRSEIASLLERAARVHWSYDGDYYFVSNNCAVETWKLLNDGVQRLAQVPLRSVTPNGLLRRLLREGIAEHPMAGDASRAMREGYYFPSHAGQLREMFAIADAALDLPQRDMEAWLEADPGERAPWLGATELRVTAALLVLEQGALRRTEAAARDMLKRRLLRRREADDATDAAATRLQALFGNAAYAGRPALLLSGDGYGLPQAEEQRALRDALAVDGGRLRDLHDALHADARQLVTPALRRRLAATETNVAALGERLRVLSGEATHRH